MYGLTAIAGPDEEPLSLADAKAHLRIDPDYHGEDGLVADWVAAAREMAEGHTGRKWVTQELRLTLPGWPCGSAAGVAGAIRLPVEPVASVDAVKYYAADGVLTTLPDSLYQAWLDHSPPLVAPAPLASWPAIQADRLGPVRVEFTAGYGDAGAVPAALRAAIRLCLAYWSEHRGDGVDPASLPQSLGLPRGAKRLLNLLDTGRYA